jgi:hypothetical protein
MKSPLPSSYLFTPVCLLVIACLLGACNSSMKGDETTTGKLIVFTPDPIHPKTSTPFDSIVQSVEVVALQTTEYSLISAISKLRVIGNYIVILDVDQRSLFFFDRAGNFIKRIDPGEDPESPREIRDFTVDEDHNIFILGTYEIVKFDPNGKYIERKNLSFEYDFIGSANPTQIAYLKGDFYLWAGSLGREMLGKYNEYALYKINNDYQVTGKYFVLKNNVMEIYRFQEFADSIIMTPTALNDTLYKITPEAVSARYWVDFKDKAISKHPDVQKKAEPESALKYRLNNSTDLCMSIRFFIATPQYTYFQYGCGDSGYEHFVNTKTRHQITGRYYHIPTGNLPMLFPAGPAGNQMVFFTEAANLSHKVTDYDKHGWPVYLLANKNFLKSIPADANPVLSFITFKDF